MASSLVGDIHEPFIRLSIQLGSSAANHGCYPFGACLVSNDTDNRQVLLTAENTANKSQDITQHAELNLISMATKKYKRDYLEKCTLYTSCEPCLMCTGAIIWSGIHEVVYALPNETLRKYTGIDHLQSCRQLLPSPDFTVIGPILEDEAVKVHQTFWSTL